MIVEQLNTKVFGYIKIVDADTGELILEKSNAIHPQNMALVLARGLAADSNAGIFYLAFGNGGTFLNSSNFIVYRSPNTIGSTASLYHQTYQVQVSQSNSDTPAGNTVTDSPSPNPALTSMVNVTCALRANEPPASLTLPNQAVSDNLTTDITQSVYTFNEICLKTQDGLMLSHLIFSPIEKSANRAFLITYTLTISVS